MEATHEASLLGFHLPALCSPLLTLLRSGFGSNVHFAVKQTWCRVFSVLTHPPFIRVALEANCTVSCVSGYSSITPGLMGNEGQLINTCKEFWGP